MKAIIFDQYGSPDVLNVAEIEKPVPKADEVLLKVHAVSANPLDWHLMRGEPFLARLEFGLRKPKIKVLGADVAGRVEAVGSNVTDFQPGDEVFGDAFPSGLGGFAEYVTVSQRTLVLKPANVSFEAAAAVPIAALTALQGLREGKIDAGQKVLVNGASGGVGTFAVQISKSFGAEVTGVCSTRNVELVRSIGADHVVDYTQADFTNQGKTYDLIFDAVGNRSVAHLQRALTPQGRGVVAGFTSMGRMLDHGLMGAWVSRTGNQKIGMMPTATSNKEDLLILQEMLATGKIVPVIDRRYPLQETAEAIRYLETARARGKVIINVTTGD